MAKEQRKTVRQTRRTFTKDFKQQAVAMLLDGYWASSVSENLGSGNTNLVYPWKAEQVADGGPLQSRSTASRRDPKHSTRT
ncbi:hypothetical protein K239x_47430 [Planctomycetes bacterium K23_9]|uniref:Transposase n=1 Tax=Stieleria marina TaxID=1930275 RepID=A0A517P039_9BACT|nr:hypothetical protein K239x_47430 [Planctomycetes bacterium K23_9]